jgi:LPXTG-site transpeptidase (sortase) family protein
MNYKGKIIASLFLGAGVFLLLQVILPLASFKIWELKNIKSEALLVSPDQPGNQAVLGVSIQNSDDNFPAIVSNVTRREAAPYSYFYISVPRLKLDNVQVLVDSNDLSKTLAHLPGSALPGEKGNMFISGHSMLPQFDRGNKAYFATLPELQKGDQISISAESGNFTYTVIGVKIVDPKDLSVIAPPDSQHRYISLMTCVPPGLNTKRMVVLGEEI